jgi:hypothetical protein
MSGLGTRDAVERVLKPIQQFTRGWMMSEPTAKRGVALGLASGEDFWIVGRAGVLGDCGPEVAAAGLAFIAPDAVRQSWERIPGGMTPLDVATEYAACCTDWGREALAPFDPDRLDRLDRLGRRIADAAPASLGLVFAGWRAMPQPADVTAAVALTTHVLREMRGAAHIVAIHACGLTPLDAIMASPAAAPRSGVPWAEHLHWSGPFPDPDSVRSARLEAEQLTSRILERSFAALDAAERADFAEIVETTRNAIDM